MDREQKREFVAGLAQVFAETSMVVVTRNQGLTVAEATDLRRRMRAAGATFKVAKNRLATRALDGTPFEALKPLLTGPTALAWSRDPVAVAKTAVDYSRTNDRLVVVGGALGTRTLSPDGVRSLAELPSREDPSRSAAGHDRHTGDKGGRRAAGLSWTTRPGLRGLCPRQRTTGGVRKSPTIPQCSRTASDSA